MGVFSVREGSATVPFTPPHPSSTQRCCFVRNNDEDNDCPNCLPCLVGWQGYLSAICRAVAAFGIIFALSKVCIVCLLLFLLFPIV